MSITPNEMLESARVLAQGNSEIAYRNTISRAYYSAMHEAKSLLPPEAPQPELRGSSHEALITSLRAFFRMPNSGRQEGATVAGHLAAMKGVRKIADYRLDANITGSDAEGCLRRAVTVFSACVRIRELRSRSANTPV